MESGKFPVDCDYPDLLILKPIDLILDKIWHRPEGTEWLEVGLTENGVTVKRTYRAGDAGTGVDNAAGRGCCGETTVLKHIR